MGATIVGYARTSTDEQEAGLAAQERDLRAAGCEEVFSERVSSVARRPGLEEALRFVRKGDTLVVTKLDRLARSMADAHAVVRQLEEKGVGLRVLTFGKEQLDTGSATGKLMFNVFVAFAQFERELMLERQREGIAKARAEGKYKGRAPTARAKAEDVRRLHGEGVGASAIAQRLGIGRASVYRILEDGRKGKAA